MKPARILVVEDDRVVARDIQQQLERIGHSVVGVTARGEDAVVLAHAVRPELVLMDIRLQGMLDGIEAAQRIRQTCQIPVVFLTAYADDETVERASQTEPFGYLLKPFENSQLRTVIEMAIYKHGADSRLRDSERRYAATLSSIGDAVIATDSHAHISFMNVIAEKLTGWALKDATGRQLSDVFKVVEPEGREVLEDRVAALLRSGKGDVGRSNALLIAKSGEEYAIGNLASPIIDDHGNITGAVLVFQDVTDARRVEDALRAAQDELMRTSRLTTMGELAVSIAHEINQPLAAVLVNASAGLNFLQKDEPDLAEANQVLVEILRDGRRAADVIRSLQALARKADPELVAVSVDDVIRDVLTLTRAELQRQGVALKIDLNASGTLVQADRVQLQQVLLNLIVNGMEAMAPAQNRPKTLAVMSRSDSSTSIEIQDSGTGIDGESLDRIFDAFFTTKAGGMGMGLAICRSIVESHGGRIEALPKADHGTVFRIRLPNLHPEGGTASDASQLTDLRPLAVGA